MVIRRVSDRDKQDTLLSMTLPPIIPVKSFSTTPPDCGAQTAVQQ